MYISKSHLSIIFQLEKPTIGSIASIIFSFSISQVHSFQKLFIYGFSCSLYHTQCQLSSFTI